MMPGTTFAGLSLAATLLCLPTAAAAEPILLPNLASFAVLGAAAVTSTGATTLSGNLGISSNSSITGITGFYGTLAGDGPGTATGTVHQGNAFAIMADSQLATAMTTLGLMGPGTLLGADLAGLTLNPGVYTVPAGISNLTGVLTLDGLGDPNALWVFQMPSSLITSAGSAVNVLNVGTAAGAGLYWNVGSAATLGAGTSFLGNILASSSITLGSGVTLGCGRALAHTGAVTMIGDTVSASCEETAYAPSGGLNGGLGGDEDDLAPVPEPATLVMLASGLVGTVGWMRRRRGSVQP